jgi:hypothetical protein
MVEQKRQLAVIRRGLGGQVDDFSNIQDGLYLKRKLNKAKGRQGPRGECTIPPPPAKHILETFTLDTPISRRAISDYVEAQARMNGHFRNSNHAKNK